MQMDVDRIRQGHRDPARIVLPVIYGIRAAPFSQRRVICHGDARITLLRAQLHEQRDHEPLIIQTLADVHASPDVCLGRASLRGRPA